MKKALYFINYDSLNDCYYIKKTSNYYINDFNYYVVNNCLYSKKNNMIFETEAEAKKELKKVNKILKYMED